LETVKEILKKRAAEAAKVVKTEEVAEGLDIITFRLGGEVYAVEAMFVHEVYPYMRPTEVPCTPEFVLGIVNIRGSFVSVIDLELILGLGKMEREKEEFMILLSNENMEFGIMVEEIQEETRVSKKAIQPLPQGLNIKTKELVDGVTEEGVILLGGKKLLEDSKIVVHEEI